jgi:hypothetical protein
MPKKNQPAQRYRHRVTQKAYVLIHEKDGDYLEGIDRHRLPITPEKLTTSDTWERMP